jgi:hydroxymethylglutaryl-CoA reductase/oxepin-CoA hydrolase/3-oxo-5,6-dehydrosuberyl-CoA semialdehyde dehydrogenase
MDKDLNRFLDQMEKLSPDTKPLWGIMSSQHMVEHLLLTVKVSNNKIKVECFNPPEKIPTLKRFLLSERPLPKNFISPLIGDGLLPLQFDSLKDAITSLKIEIEDYYKFFDKNPEAVLINPTFGELNRTEWEIFHKKHFIHHLSQFGIDLD